MDAPHKGVHVAIFACPQEALHGSAASLCLVHRRWGHEMTFEIYISAIEEEWEPETGFFWRIRQGDFRKDDFERTLRKLAAVPNTTEQLLPARFVSVVWYIPIFMEWQRDRVRECGVNPDEYAVATNHLMNEVERISWSAVRTLYCSHVG
jgi:hypothetical protein